ncbi:nickel pincer cofactor biosynthesis protein LarC [Nodosilinea sp. E11]|uniref:nickel pincer cofactor biosynthesis protein LarC n=1 Tax=Nodosilinea sp. E11 TaxID=3037479 RepID=UPI00293455B2|nr:nickel pincer cofactor biosynthesis protein LarC [Nodosilinea sp. E11]WOD39324.1 nickel pincer cofactor biosynthesis protein LarC [Nodosilinea sp. E11]
MKTIVYLDCPTGIAGDMCLAALVDAGVPLDYLQQQLTNLGLNHEFTLSVTSTHRQGLRACYAQVQVTAVTETSATTEIRGEAVSLQSNHSQANHSQANHSQANHSQANHSQANHGQAAPMESTAPGGDRPSAPAHDHDHRHPGSDHSHSHPLLAPAADPTRNLSAIERLITQATLPDRARQWSLKVFRCLAEAEAAVHGIALDQVHFHEVGATDAIVDIVGTCLGLDYLGVDMLVCSPLPTGRGRVRAAHGWLPVPAPAVLKLMESRPVPLYSNGLEGELVTPTGAAIAIALADHFGDPPAMTLHRVGLGAGGKDLPVANILRLWLGQTTANPNPTSLSSPVPGQTPQSAPKSIPYDHETIILLETQIDDMVPQVVGYLHERLYAAGALEVFTQPIAMKKSRPGLLITVICTPEHEPPCTDILFAETPTLGIRRQSQQRWLLSRQLQTLQTTYGPVTVKLAYHPQTQAILNIHPEYEDCALLARHHHLPWQVIYHSAITAWYSQPSLPGQAQES